MSDVIKIIYLDQDNIKKMIVFFGNNHPVDSTDSNIPDISELFKTDNQNTIFEGVFSKDQLEQITKQDINVHFSKQFIYIDDTIETIKKKIISVFSNELSLPISFNEIYLFSKQIQQLNNTEIYDNLTQNGKMTLTQNIMFQFLANINNINIDKLPVKDIYTYSDIIDLNLAEKPTMVNVALGQRFIIGDNLYSYTINPFKVVSFSKILSTNADNIITTTNKSLLMSDGFLFENTIYVCLTEDVFKYAVSKNISEKTSSKVYYPFLGDKQVFDLKDLKERKYELLEENKTLLSSNFKKQVNNIEMFHRIYNTRKSELNYIEQGIQSLEFVLSQDSEFNVPLEVIFKLIHSTKTVPLIKMNAGKRQEKIYRLYCNKTAKNGKKIPYLSKNAIFKLVKTLGMSKRVSCYMEVLRNDKKIPIVVEFDNLSNVYVKIDFKETKSIPDIESLIKEAVNPIIETIRDYVVSSGYSMKLFDNLYDKHVEITNIKYFSYISIEKNINLNNLLGCVSSIFNVLVGELKNGIVMRYKRVSNFNEMDSQEAFIVELLNRANEDEDIVKMLMDNFQMKETDAQLKIADLLNSLQMVQTLNKNRKLKIKNNPGFLTKITQDPFKQNIMVEMENINDIFYMSVIPIYIDSLIRITQSPETSSVDLSTIDGLCKTKKVDDEGQIEEIIAPAEKGFVENIPTAIVAENLTFGESASKAKDKTINVLDFLYDDDDDDDDDEDDDDDDEGIDVELDEDDLMGGGVDSDSDNEGIDIDLESPSPDNEGVDIDLESPSPDNEGVDIDLESPSPDTTDKNVVQPSADKPSADKPSADTATKTKTKRKPVKLSIQDGEKLEKNITGMRIADPNPFFKAMHEKDPTLFLTESDGKYNAYSRVCPWNKRKQPVILTDEEKERIDKEHPGSYEQAIKYGSDPKKQFWYICPRYWDLKNNTSLTDKEVKSGKYGGLIPQNAKTVPAGTNIWEFSDAEGAVPRTHVGKDGKYVQHHPGFLKKDIHPDGKCVPCCFASWDKPAQKKRREQCGQNEREDDGLDKSRSKFESKQDVDEYIKGPEKFPLEEGRFGYLPFIVQKFIDTDNKTCQISAINKNLKKNQPCYLRRGTENNKIKSFLACIADIYSEKNNNQVLTIETFVNEKLIKMITPDTFVSLQNGSLISEFQSKNIENVDIDLDVLKDSAIYSKLKTSDNIQLKRIASALQNFTEYLKSPSSQIDYTYLWDLICQPNDLLFAKGINLTILNLPQDDVTANINIICPTNYYSLSKFDPKKDTAIIMQKYEYFEPIYIVVDKSKTNLVNITTTKLYTPELMSKVPNLKKLSTTIQDIYSSMCKPMSSLPKAYRYKEIKFKRNHTLEKTIAILNKYNMKVQSLVINYDDKVIGLNIENSDQIGFIPCFPSGIISSYELVDMENKKQQKNLEETVQFLNMVSDETKGEILCKPVVKILEGKLIVGLLTETNQFVPLVEPELDTDQSIKHTIQDENFFQVNKVTQTSKKIDKKREEYVKKIKLETELYNAFRNKLRTLLNNFKNKNIRDEIEGISNSAQMVYYLQLERLIRLIKNLMSEDVEFVPVTNNSITRIEANLKKGDVILIPKKNLLSKLDNEEIYYSKISDELIRYVRIKQFMFAPNMFLSFTDLKYNLNADEIILLQSLLSSDYFDDLIPDVSNKYVSFNSYDTAMPNISQKYDNEYMEKEETIVEDKMESEKVTNGKNDNNKKQVFELYNTCPISTKDITAKLKMKFRGGYKDIVFSSTNSNCTFDVALTLVNNTSPSQNADINSIKYKLVEKYQELFAIYSPEMIAMFDYYGYMVLSKELANGQITIENMIMNEEYHLTNFDLILISDIYDIPLTMIAPKVFKENQNEYLSMNIKNENTYIVRTSTVNKYEKTIPTFKMIINKEGDALLNISKLPEESIRNEITRQTNTVVELLKSFQKKNKTNDRNQINDRNEINDEDNISTVKKVIKKRAKLKTSVK